VKMPGGGGGVMPVIRAEEWYLPGGGGRGGDAHLIGRTPPGGVAVHAPHTEATATQKLDS